MDLPQLNLKFVKKLLGKNEHLKSNISGINGDPISVVRFQTSKTIHLII
jgi:hypothetical protein